MGKIEITRRQFVVTTAVVGGGMALGFAAPGHNATAAVPDPWGKATPAGSSEFTAYLYIAPDDTVTVRVPTPEIGNGALTQNIMIVRTVCSPKAFIPLADISAAAPPRPTVYRSWGRWAPVRANV